jgi:hypothetical protein
MASQFHSSKPTLVDDPWSSVKAVEHTAHQNANNGVAFAFDERIYFLFSSISIIDSRGRSGDLIVSYSGTETVRKKKNRSAA